VIKRYLKIIRLHIVAGGFLAFTLGALLGLVNGGRFDALHFVLFYAVIFFGDLSTHFSNDYFDYEHDCHNRKKTVFSGSKLLLTNPSMLLPARNVSVVLLLVSVLLAVLSVALGFASVELLLVGLGVNFLGWFYSAPPLRLVSHGLGEAAIALAVGLGIPAAGYLSTVGKFDGWFALFLFPFLMYGFMLALCLETPDAKGDRLGDKKTLGVLKGLASVYTLTFVVSLAAMLTFVGYTWLAGGYAVNFWVVAVFAAVPFAVGVVSLIGLRWRRKAEVLSLVGVFSLFVFNVLMVAYLFSLAAGVF
jgi:1,4-dihydroxy-2-naphthoate polyprenyltransferase